ncbi:MAG: SOS response-associated peptidase [Kiloniellales bacterium]
MCGRYSLTSPLEELCEVFGFPERPNLAPHANIAPGQDVAAIRLGEDDSEPRRFVWLRWGLIPSWAKDPGMGGRMINARAETVAEKPTFRAAFRARRCLILADGFYEWRAEGGRKQPYRIARPDGRPFAFAGLWERWQDPAGGEKVESCSIITTEANALLRGIHPRMPVILGEADFDSWLAPGTAREAARALLKPCAPEALVCYRVSARVNSPANDDLTLIEPLEGEVEPAGQPRLL